jgi:bifunctional UDP-N-acetylglucosamine pyrophosphorylase/glucosamine-1-phosphate N-acetyltransferase
MSLDVVILAAGKGTRMHSSQPKVLHPLAGRPLLRHVVETARALHAEQIVVVYGHGGEQVRSAFDDEGLVFVLQDPQLGTGHAVQQAAPVLKSERTLILYGDVPLTRVETLARAVLDSDGLSLIAQLEDAASRLFARPRSTHRRESDSTPDESNRRSIPGSRLRPTVEGHSLRDDNAQAKSTIDVIACAVTDRVAIHTPQPSDTWEILSNSKQHRRAGACSEVRRGCSRPGARFDPARIDVAASHAADAA